MASSTFKIVFDAVTTSLEHGFDRAGDRGKRLNHELDKTGRASLNVREQTLKVEAAQKRAAASTTRYGRASLQAAQADVRLEREQQKLNRQLDESHRKSGLLAGGLKRAAGAAVGLAAGYVGISTAKHAVNTTEELGKSTLTLARSFGLSTRLAGEWAAVSRARGTDGRQLVMGFKSLATQVHNATEGIGAQGSALDDLRKKNDLAYRRAEQDAARSRDQVSSTRTLTRLRHDQAAAEDALASRVSAQAKTFDELGISQRALAKHGGDLQWVLEHVSDGLAAMPSGTDKAAISARLFGRTWTSIAPLVRSGSDEMRAQMGLADRYGATLGGKTVKDVQRLLEAQREQRLAWLGINVTLGQALIPFVTKGARTFADFVAQMRSGEGAGGRFAHTAGEIAREAGKVGRWVGHAADEVARFADEHPALLKVAGVLTGIGLTAKAISFAGKITGISTLIGWVTKLGGAYRGTAAAAEAAAVAEGAAGTAGGVAGVGRGLASKLGRRAGIGMGIGLGGAVLGQEIGGRSGRAVSGAAIGAGIGMLAGPYGAAAGAVLGALMSRESPAERNKRILLKADIKTFREFASEAARLRDAGDAPALERLSGRIRRLGGVTDEGSASLKRLSGEIRKTASSVHDQSWDFAGSLAKSIRDARGVTRQNLAGIVNQFAVLTPAMRQETTTALLAQVRVMESKGQLVKGSTRALVATINAQWPDIDTAASKAIVRTTKALALGLARAIPIVAPAAKTLAKEMRLAMHGEFAQIRVDFGQAMAGIATPRGAGSAGRQLGSLAGAIAPLFKRRGGTIRHYQDGGLVPAFVSPGEEIEHGGGSWIVPGAREARDSMFTMLPVGARVWTDHGQQLRASGVPDDAALAMQAPHFARGGVVRGKVSTFGPPGEAAGGMASGRSSSAAGIALNLQPGTDSGWNNSTTQGWISRARKGDPLDFLVRIGGHRSVLPLLDLGPAGSTGRAIDVTGAGARRMGIEPSRFPTDSIGTAQPIGRGGKSLSYLRQPAIVRSRLVDLLQPYGSLDAFQQGFDFASSPGNGRRLFKTPTGTDSDLFRSAVSGVRPNTRDLPHRMKLTMTGIGRRRTGIPRVDGVLAASAQIVGRPYIYGGGHSGFSLEKGYDCSGAVSYGLHGGNFLSSPQATDGLKAFGRSGSGRYITVGVRGSSGRNAHTMMKVGPYYLESNSAGVHWASGWDGDFPIKRHPAGFRHGGVAGVAAAARRRGVGVGDSRLDPRSAGFLGWGLRRGGVVRFRAGGRAGSGSPLRSTLDGVRSSDTGQGTHVVVAMRHFGELIDEGTTVGYRRLVNVDDNIRREIRGIAKGGLTGRERVQVRRLRGVLTLLEAEMGKRVGSLVASAQRTVDAVGRRQTSMSRRLAIRGVSEDSVQGLGTLMEADTGSLSVLRGALGTSRAALRRARRRHDPAAVQAIKDQIDGIKDQIGDSQVSLAERRRALAHAQRYDPINAQLALDQLSGNRAAQLNDLNALRSNLSSDLADATQRQDYQAMQDLAVQLQSVNSSIDDLTQATQEQNRIAQEQIDLNKQIVDNQNRLAALVSSQQNALLGALTAALNGTIGGRVGLGFQTPGFAGGPARY